MSTYQGPRLEVRGLTKHFPLRRTLFGRSSKVVHAVDNVSFSVSAGETLALVGESGCGKSTVARLIAGLRKPTAGEIRFDGDDISGKSGIRGHRRDIQLIFQNALSALNRRKTIRHTLGQPLEVHRLTASARERELRCRELIRQVSLPDDYLDRFPTGMSGGELQRVAVARSLAVQPKLLVLDEPTSSLDVSVKAKLLNLFMDLQGKLDLTYVLITHEIGLASHIANRMAIMYLGEIVEIGPTDEIMLRPRHPYTKLLIGSLPVAEPGRRRQTQVLVGEVPSASDPPSGCRFHTRCPIAIDKCKVEHPELRDFGPTHRAACHLAEMASELIAGGA